MRGSHIVWNLTNNRSLAPANVDLGYPPSEFIRYIGNYVKSSIAQWIAFLPGELAPDDR